MSAYFITLQYTEAPEQVAREPPTRNSPRIAAFVGEEAKQYFVIVEQRVLCQVSNVCFFLQDYVLAMPDSLHRPATYLATASDLIKNWLSITDNFFAAIILY